MQRLLSVLALMLCLMLMAGCAAQSSSVGSSSAGGNLPTLRVRQGQAVYVTVDDNGQGTALENTIGNYVQSEKSLKRVTREKDADYTIDVVVRSVEQAGTRSSGGMSAREGITGGVMGAGLGALAGGLIGGNKGALIGMASGAALGVGAMAMTSNNPSGTVNVWELRADVRLGRAGEEPEAVEVVVTEEAQDLRREDALVQLEDRLAMRIVDALRLGQ